MRNNPIYSNGLAILLMAGAVTGWSFTPLFVALGDGGSPFVFNAAWRVGVVFGCVLILTFAYRDMLFRKDTWRVVWRRIGTLPMLLWVVAYLELAFYAWATQFIDVAIVAVLYETWPIMLVILTGWIFRREARYKKIAPISVLLFIVAFVGVGSVIASQAGGLSGFQSGGAGLPALALGVALAIVATATGALGAFGFRWAADVASELPNGNERDGGSLELFAVVLGLGISNLLSLFLTAPAGLARNEPLSPETVSFGIAGGAIIGSASAIAWRKANMITDYLGINVMGYLVPAVALVWLSAFSLIGNVSVGYLLVGVTLIILANIGIYFEMRESQRAEREDLDINALIAAGESDTVEFKSTLRMNSYTNKSDRRLEYASLKTIAAFLNTDGGALIIGVADDGSPVGIAADGFANEDRMKLHLTNIAGASMGHNAMTYVDLIPGDYKGVRVLAARCRPSDAPIFSKEGNSEHFYIRSGPSTISLPPSATHSYIARRF